MTIYIILIILTALLFDITNGFNDAANSVATVVATRVLSPRVAVLWAAFFNFIAAFLFDTHVARTIGQGLLDPRAVDPNVVFSALVAAIIWNVICTLKGIPISVSHALVGAMAGSAIVKVGPSALQWMTIIKIAVFIVLSPLIGLFLGWLMMVVTAWICRYKTPRGVDGVFRNLQLVSAAVYSLSHGFNDAQKTMGVIFCLLMSVPALQSYATHSGDPNSHELAWWIILSCQAAIAIGTYAGGWKVVKKLGHQVTKLQPVGGFCAETGGGVTILALSQLGIPVSTTHTITGAIFGVGILRGIFSVRWRVGKQIMTAWILTLPVSAVLAVGIYEVVILVVSMLP